MLEILKSYFNDEQYFIIVLNGRLLIKNYSKLFELTDEYMLVEIGKYTYRVVGSNLTLVKNYHKDLEITGNIEVIEKI